MRPREDSTANPDLQIDILDRDIDDVTPCVTRWSEGGSFPNDRVVLPNLLASKVISVLSPPDPTPSTWRLWGQEVTGRRWNSVVGDREDNKN
jgi:hypothetical protein